MDKYLSGLSPHLSPSEDVDAAVLGSYETYRFRTYTTRMGLLAATSQRVVIFGFKPRNNDVWTFPYADINTLGLTKSLGATNINLDTTFGDRRLMWVEEGDVGQLTEIIRERINLAKNGGRVADELSKLAELRRQGLLSDEEWERATALFFGKPVSKQEQMIAQIRRLDSLRRDGVISQSEFNSKKWDLLSRNQ
jgi:hypothetical protein